MPTPDTNSASHRDTGRGATKRASCGRATRSIFLAHYSLFNPLLLKTLSSGCRRIPLPCSQSAESAPAADVHYHDYLQLDKILGAQAPESDKHATEAHDEMLFIIIHQTYELWFKQLHWEADSLVAIMKKPALDDNSPEL